MIGIGIWVMDIPAILVSEDLPANTLVTDDNYGLDDGSGNYLVTDEES